MGFGGESSVDFFNAMNLVETKCNSVDCLTVYGSDDAVSHTQLIGFRSLFTFRPFKNNNKCTQVFGKSVFFCRQLERRTGTYSRD